MQKGALAVAAALLSQTALALQPAGAMSIVAKTGLEQSDPLVQKAYYYRRGGAYYHGGAYHGGYYHRGYAYHPGWRGGYGRWGGWVRPAGFWWGPGGAIAAGAAIGFVGAATAAAWAGPAPGPGLCWYYTTPARTQGFWDACQ